MKYIIPIVLSTLSLFAESTEEQLVEQWLKTEQLIAQEAEDWKTQQAHSQRLLTLYAKELTLLDEELTKSGNNATLVDEEAESLKTSLASSEAARKKVITYLAQLKPQILELFKKLPLPLQEQLKDQELTLHNEVNNASVDQTLQAVIKILQDSARFNRNYVFEEHPIQIKGESLRARVLYLGLSHAIFIAGDTAGEAKPSPQGWVFTERPEIKKQAAKAFAIQDKQIASSLFEIPLKPSQKSHE